MVGASLLAVSASLLALCPGRAVVLKEQNVNASSLPDGNETSLPKAECTGGSDPDLGEGKCYTVLTDDGGTLTIRLNSFNASTQAGSVSISASGVAPMNCERGFEKMDVDIEIADLQQCMSPDIWITRVRYCADQDQMIIDELVTEHHDAGEEMRPHEMVLEQAPCLNSPPEEQENGEEGKDEEEGEEEGSLVAVSSSGSFEHVKPSGRSERRQIRSENTFQEISPSGSTKMYLRSH
jgi:hypothetical protein